MSSSRVFLRVEGVSKRVLEAWIEFLSVLGSKIIDEEESVTIMYGEDYVEFIAEDPLEILRLLINGIDKKPLKFSEKGVEVIDEKAHLLKLLMEARMEKEKV